ncbi:MAG: DUF389 domain-containing protein, partial [Proteobacteria bacterium]|nr:DUF389 domain-containing protein [Pseudomonadota bacterium]
EIASVVSPGMNHDITKDSAEATWEEMELMIAREGNMTLNGMLLMAVAGVIASVGLMNSVLHLVVAAMVIAPGFEPVARVSLSLACGSGSWRRGFIDTGKGYSSLLAGAFLGAALVRLIQGSEPGGSYLPAGVLLEYWSSITATSLLASAVAGAAGGVLIATNRSILTAGVMIALALIPTPAVVAIGVLDGDFDMAGRGLLRWIIEVVIVLVLTVLVFTWKRVHIQKRAIWW